MKFECKGCGACCKDFGSGKCLPIFEWEKEILEQEAKKLGISLNIKPTVFLLDKKSGKAFAYKYGMFNMPCPFLINNKCSIYLKRPLICQKFPIFKTPEFSKVIDENSFLDCVNFDSQKFLRKFVADDENVHKEKEDMNEEFRKVFGNCFQSALRSDMITNFIEKMIQEYDDERIIKVRKISNYDSKKHEILGFFEFLISIGELNDSDKNKIIQTFVDDKKFQKFFSEK